MSNALATKTPGEYKYFLLDLVGTLDGDLISSISSTSVSNADSALQVVEASVNDAGTGVFIWLRGGTPENMYTVTVSVLTENGETETKSFLCQVFDYNYAAPGELHVITRGTPPATPADAFLAQDGGAFLLQDGSTLQLV